uniref:Ion transport domain-containing protein n=1 Tax=Parascaris univalens TaxID=6257 RepID=A0A915BGC6_PARUN
MGDDISDNESIETDPYLLGLRDCCTLIERRNVVYGFYKAFYDMSQNDRRELSSALFHSLVVP